MKIYHLSVNGETPDFLTKLKALAVPLEHEALETACF